jgi:hypothetical protein
MTTNQDLVQVSTGTVVSSTKQPLGTPLPPIVFHSIVGSYRHAQFVPLAEKQKMDFFLRIVPHEQLLLSTFRHYSQIQHLQSQAECDFYLKAFYVSAFIAEQLSLTLGSPIYPLITQQLESPTVELVKQTCRLSHAHEVLQWRTEVLFNEAYSKWTRQWWSLTGRKVALGFNAEQMARFMKAFADSNCRNVDTESYVFKMQDKMMDMRKIKTFDEMN